MSDQTPRDALIHDLAIVLAGSLHPSAEIGPAPRLAARRMRDVLGIADGSPVRGIEALLRTILAEGSPAILEAFRAVTGWSDEDVLHYATCDRCVPVCGAEEENCPQSPASIALAAHIAAKRAAGDRGGE